MANDVPKPAKLDALGSMLEGAEPPSEEPALVCGACDVALSPDGQPVEPVTDENVEYLQAYVDGEGSV